MLNIVLLFLFRLFWFVLLFHSSHTLPTIPSTFLWL